MTASYVYNAEDRRISKTVNGVTTNHIWDRDNIIYESDASKNEIERFYYGRRLAESVAGNESKRYGYDPHGNVTHINGAWLYDYDSFGNQTMNLWDISKHYYCGEYYDAETGFIYLRNRYYDPTIGRFITEDPIKDGLNWYVYCGNNPVNRWDPTGYITEDEQKMYENGEMAPGAYTFLMLCTYYYYLQDDDEGRDYWSGKAEVFRNTDYTDTGDWYWNWTIEEMPSRPTDELTAEEHYFRNGINLQFEWDEFQKLNERLPDNLKWRELPWHQSIYHKFSTEASWQGNNRKYVSACEHFEAVYTKENYLVDEEFNSTYMGTYNYYGLSQIDKHKKYDVDPYYSYGNVR